MSVNFTYQIGGKVYDSTYASAMKLDNGHIFHADMLNAWSEDNKGSNIPRIQFNDTYTASQSDRFLTNASYLTLQDFTYRLFFAKAVDSEVSVLLKFVFTYKATISGCGQSVRVLTHVSHLR